MVVNPQLCWPFQAYKTVELVRAKGGKVSREAGPVKGGTTVIAFVEDPDGYKFELLQRPPTPEPFCQVMLRVGDLPKSIAFYETVGTPPPTPTPSTSEPRVGIRWRTAAWSS